MKNKNKVIYSSISSVRSPLKLLKSMFFGLKNSWGLARSLMIRDISSQYRQTILSYFWVILPPIVTSLIFILLNKAQIINVTNLSVPYPVFVFTGTIFFQLFIDGLYAPLKEFSNNRPLISKINIPKEFLIITGLGQTLFSFFIKLIMLLVIIIIFKVPLKITSIFIFFPIAGLVFLGMAIGLVILPFGLLYKDVQNVMYAASPILIWVSPVAFQQPQIGILSKIMLINPISPFIIITRDLLFNETITDLKKPIIVFAVSLIIFFIGWVFYRLSFPFLIERMDA